MKKISRRWMSRLAVIGLGSGFVLGGCDPTVRDTVLGGVSEAATGLASTFIQAFFKSLTATDPNSDTPTTVQAKPAVDPGVFT